MRKGRSSRRSRVSRPNLGTKTSKTVQNVDARAAQPAVPNVIVGVPAPTPSEPPRVEAEGAVVVADALQVAVARDTRVEDPIEPEPASIERLKVEAPREPEPEEDTIEGAIETLEAKPEEPPVEAKIEEKVEAKVEAKVEEQVEARQELTPPTPAAAIEEESIPPVGDLAVHEKFFSQGDLTELAGDDDDLDEVGASKTARKSAPEVVQRRARFARYVTWAVGISAVVCLAAVVRTALTPSAKTLAAPAHAAMIVDVPAKPAAPPAAEPAAAAAAAPAAPAPASAEEPKPAAAEPAPAAKVEGDAKAEKAAAKKALERGKIAEAIEAGERAVALDETDGEAWLILGAAYQEKGKMADARRAYTACVKQGKTGPRHECAAMLR